VKRSLIALVVFVALAVVLFLAPGHPVHAGNDANSTSLSVAAGVDDATESNFKQMADFCVKKGGEVDVRLPYYNTNDNNVSNWVRMAGQRTFCKFTSKDDGSRIHVLLTTLYTKAPTLAALAYYAKVPYSGKCNGNPASCYCSQLGGTDLFGGINPNGGGWVQLSDPVDTVLEACILPDMSTIDSWGLTYHQANITRGKNLNGVLRFKNPYK
jgi:putative hemolysin